MSHIKGIREQECSVQEKIASYKLFQKKSKQYSETKSLGETSLKKDKDKQPFFFLRLQDAP